MSKQEKLISANKLNNWIIAELGKRYPEEQSQYVDGRETVLEILRWKIVKGELDADPVPTIKPGDKHRCPYCNIASTQQEWDEGGQRMNRDWHKDMERIQLGRKLFETYGAVIEGVNSKESLDEVLGYWLQQYAELQSRNDEMLKVLERIKADIDEFRSYIDIEACESVEDQARAFNEVLKAERERADDLQERFNHLADEHDNLIERSMKRKSQLAEEKERANIAELAYKGLAEDCVTRGEYDSLHDKYKAARELYWSEKERADKAKGAFEQIKERIEEARTDGDEMGWRYALNDINNIILGYEDDTEG